MSSHCLLASMVSDDKSGVHFEEDPLYMTSCFSLAAFKFFSLSLGFSNLSKIYLSVDFFKFILELVKISGCLYHVFHQILNSPLFLQVFFLFLALFFCDFCNASIVILMVGHRSHRFYSFSFIFFLFAAH